MFETAMFLEGMEKLGKRCRDNAEKKGYWKDWNFGEKIALLHSEVTELLEAHRKGNPPCEKTYPSPVDGKPITIGVIEGGEVRTITSMEEEAADILIRLTSLCSKLEIDLGRVVLAKLQYNESTGSPTKKY